MKTVVRREVVMDVTTTEKTKTNSPRKALHLRRYSATYSACSPAAHPTGKVPASDDLGPRLFSGHDQIIMRGRKYMRQGGYYKIVRADRLADQW